MFRWILAALMLLSFGACQDDPPALRDCPVGRSSPEYEVNETRCDGLDNDCDGLTDVLVPGLHNACESTLTGDCRVGVSTCAGGERVCLTPPPVDETWDGRDNDCDGQTDEAIAADSPLPASACVLAPPYLWETQKTPRPVAAVRALLRQAGIPFTTDDAPDRRPKPTWAAQLAQLQQCRLAIIPGYVVPTLIDVKAGQLKLIEDWVAQGGVLIWIKPLGPNGDKTPEIQALEEQVLRLGGAVASKQQLFGDHVKMTGKGAATLWLDHGPERDMLLSNDPHDTAKQVETLTYTILPGTAVLANAVRGTTTLGPTWLRRKLGHGAVYTLGFDPTGYTPQRCYVNCFDPGLDVGRMLLKGAWREAGHGHYVVKHTVPGVESGVLLSSHDIDAPDAFNAGEWGGAGAIRMADMEKKEGVTGSYFITTDYVAKYFNPAVVKRLCQLGQCPEGGHSIQHLYWNSFPVGQCDVTKATYVPSEPTVCGEVRVNLEILRSILPANTRLDAWRTPYLEINPHQYQILSDHGIIFDSSLATGDLRTNLPVDLPRFPYFDLEDVSKIPELWVFPVNLEDGIGWYEGDVEHRRELSPMWLSEFKHRWAEQLEGNAANGGWNVMLVHPSMGVGAGVVADNLQTKIDAARWAIRYAKKLGMHVASITKLGDFWRGRQHTRLTNLTYHNGAYKGHFKVGKVPARRFSLEFGDEIATFTQNTSSPVVVKGHRVVFEWILPAHAEIAFTATVAKGGK